MNFNHIFSLNTFLQYCVSICLEGLPRWLSGKEFACKSRRCRRLGFNPWVQKIPWRRKWQPTPVFLPRESHGQRSLVGCSPWGHKESDMTDFHFILTVNLSWDCLLSSAPKPHVARGHLRGHRFRSYYFCWVLRAPDMLGRWRWPSLCTLELQYHCHSNAFMDRAASDFIFLWVKWQKHNSFPFCKQVRNLGFWCLEEARLLLPRKTELPFWLPSSPG